MTDLEAEVVALRAKLKELTEVHLHCLKQVGSIPDHWVWASWHEGGDLPDNFQETGEDKQLAEKRVEVWRASRPQYTSLLMRRPVYLGEWEEVDDDRL